MEMKKIKHSEAAYILCWKRPHLFVKYCCIWKIGMNEPITGRIVCNMRWWMYVLLFIPMHIIKFNLCLWDGGIKNFCIEPRIIHNYNIIGGLTIDDERTKFGRLKIIWKKHTAA